MPPPLHAPAPPERATPFVARTLLLTLLVMLGTLGVLLPSGSAHRLTRSPGFRPLAPADTDSVAVPSADAIRMLRAGLAGDTLAPGTPDSLAADTLPPDTGRVARYVRLRRPGLASTLLDRPAPLFPARPAVWQRTVTLDSTERAYTIEEQVGGEFVRLPVRVGFDAYAEARFRDAIDDNFRALIDQRRRSERGTGRGGPLFNVVIPGGRQSAFSTIFGKNEVSLRVNGQANINAGFDYRKSDQQAAVGGRAAQVDPTFKQDLSLAINGTIGDKLRVDVSWDTQSQFDYQNQLKLQYTGYEDEIIQSIEAGNVFLQTPSSLIRGGQSLFGIKSQFQIGGIRLTTVASQQEGQSNALNISGGAQTTQYELRATDYEANRHFFLGYYFRNNWEAALSRPPTILIRSQDDTGFAGIEKITDVEVYKLQRSTIQEIDRVPAVAIADLGEPPAVRAQELGSLYRSVVAPRPDQDQYGDQELDDRIRRVAADSASAKDYLLRVKGLRDSDVQTGQSWKRLELGRDYTLDATLGYLSLRNGLADSEALAVAIRYQTTDGRIVTVGDFSGTTGGASGQIRDGALVLKLLRGTNPIAPSADFVPTTWYLEMRNIYRLPGRALTEGDFQLDVLYQPPSGAANKTLPGSRTPLLRQLGLDRLGPGNSQNPDNRVDFSAVVDAENGLLVFPFLEPFGQRIAETNGENPQALPLAFTSLYDQKQETARRETQFDVYRIAGEYQGGAQSFFDLGAWSGLVEGSVRVTAGGVTLTEGVDYQVDYTGSGTVTIINQSFINAGRDVEITYEQNSLFDLQKKTLLGARADYALADRLQLGATVMRMSQRSQVDKFRIGDEPISNTIWGIDGRFTLEPRWLTQAVDALPFVQTRAPSKLDLRAEFAQLRPGGAQTVAFRQTRRELRDDGFDFKPDELDGVSYIDDFESFENTYSLKAPGAWRLASAPDSLGAVDRAGVIGGTDGAVRRSYWRGGMAWYQLPADIRELSGNALVRTSQEAILPLRVTDVYPDRNVANSNESRLTTFDLYFDPFVRGPYNYTQNLDQFFLNPKDTWGGLITSLPDGYRDFQDKNVEFIEFVFRAFAEDGTPLADPGEDAFLYVDLGTISEDVVPDGVLSAEDGLSLEDFDPAGSSGDFVTPFARPPTIQENGLVDISGRRTEDLGLDGLVSYNPDAYSPATSEANFFAAFVAAAEASGEINAFHRAEKARIALDPSGDDYHHYLDDRFFTPELFPSHLPGFPDGATVQQRYLRYFAGHELNSFETQNTLDVNSSIRRGNTKLPDTEDLDNNSSLDETNRYFQYRVPLSRDELERQGQPGTDDDFVVGEIVSASGNRTGYYQVRIPVRNFTRRVGSATDFTAIQSIRLWTTGHEVPVTIRMASLELVGSQWQKSARVTTERRRDIAADARYTISSVNTEEDSRVYRKPIGTVTPINRGLSGQSVEAREQSLVLSVEDLRPGAQVGIYKAYTSQTLDLLKYSNVRMFAHLHGNNGAGEWTEADRGRVVMFVRFGASESGAYYEYEQPLTPSSILSADARQLWPDENALNIEIAAFNQLKFARDRRIAEIPADSVWYGEEADGTLAADAPDPERFAPPGTRLGIKGNPSLNNVNTIVIGLRNTADSTSTDPDSFVREAVLWVNELRVSGYDQTNGWSGLANLDLRLADFASVRAALTAQTDGFGALTSTLDERDQNATLNWSVNTDLRLDKFIPERFGWTLPLNVSAQSNTTTPRFSPARGDVRLDAILDGISQSDLPRAEREALRQQELDAAQTRSTSRSLALNGISKTGSKTAFLRNTVDAISLTFATSEADQSSPSQSVNDAWRWNTGFSYRLPTQQPRTVRPLWFLDDLPVIGLLGDLRYNYVPTSLSFAASAARSFAVTRERPDLLRPADAEETPERIDYPYRETHSFIHGRDFTFQYNPFSFLRTTFDTGVDQSLSLVGVDSVYNRVELIDGREVVTFLGTGEAGKQAARDDTTGFVETRAEPVPFRRAVARAFSGDDDFRTDGYTQNFTATLSPRLSNKVRWITFNDLAYNARYTWNNGAIGQNFGAGVRTSVTVGTGLTLRPETFWSQFGFYKTLQDEQRRAEAEATARRQQREREREQRREARRQQREQERLEREREAQRQAADSTGTPPDVEEDEADEAGDADELAAPDTLGADDAPTPRTPPGPPADTARAETRRGFRLPLPSGRAILRRTVLTLGGITDVQLQYTGGYTSQSSNVAENGDGTDTPYSLFDALGGRGPSLGYRLGFTRHVDDADRLLDSTLQVRDNFADNHKVTARTTLRPTPNLTVNLSWDVSWENRQDDVIRQNRDLVTRQSTFGGGNRAFVWVLGANYGDLFERQRDAFLADAALTAPGDTIRDANGDGRVALTNRSVVNDFLDTFTRGVGTLDGRGLLPFPMPSWQISYSGISRWPLIRTIAQSATLRHNYSADYSSAFNSSPAGQFSSFRVGRGADSRVVGFELDRFQASSVNVNERFAPLIGMDLRLKGNVGTTFQYNTSNLYTLSTTNYNVTRRHTDELSFSVNYQKQGLKLPFLRSKLNNRLTLSLSVQRSVNDDRQFQLRTAVGDAVTTNPGLTPADVQRGDYVSINTSSARLTVQPLIGYQFSNAVQGNFSLKYERFDGDTRTPSFTNITGLFTVRVSITSN